MSDPDPAELDLSDAKPPLWRNLSFVWLVPVLALAVSLGLAWKSFADRGVLIEITFLSASGVTPGETTLRYRDVVIGKVEQVTFTPDLSHVVVRARIDKDVAPFLDADTQFWVVRPRVTAQGISGLSTVLAGVYIEGAWDQQVVGEAQRQFTGGDGPPLVQPGREGKRITLLATDGSLVTEGAPVFFHGIEVGRLERPRLTLSSDAILVDAFIEAPHDRRLNSATRFWDTSGFEVSLTSAGLSVDFKSVSSLLAGGVEFDSIFEGGEPVSAGYAFNVYEDEATARKNVLAGSTADAVNIAAEFGESVSGLEPGADVRYGGLRVGEVTSIAARVDETEIGPEVQLMANLAIEPERLGLPRGSGEKETLDFFEAAAARGLRARLAPKSLFNATLQVELVDIADAPPAEFQRDAKPLPILPSVKSTLPDFTATAQGVFERINALPIEEVLNHAITLMASIEALATAEETKAAPGAVVALLDDTRALVNNEATQAIPGELRAAIADLRAIVTELKDAGAVKNLASAIENADKVAGNLATASEDFPALIDDLRAVAAKANALNAEELVASATRLLDSADKVVGTDAARGLPQSLSDALDQIRGMVQELRDGGAVANINQATASAKDAADAVARATETLPELSARLQRLVEQADRLVAAYGDRSDFNQETVAALREVRSAARAVSQLAKAIERKPNSLLIGR